MSAFRPGIGDPLETRCGQPNWNLQTKTRHTGPPDQLGQSLVVKGPQASVYGTAPPRDDFQRGMGHFDCHLARTTNEQVHKGYGIPDHVRSGFDRPDKKTGRQPPPKKEPKYDPKDGGVWEPVRREYPKVIKTEHMQGTKVVDRPKRETRPVDIWPDTITVRDQFKPGGLKMFEGKRSTNVTAFPGSIGYIPPDPKIDYSSVQQGGPFGFKLLHKNEAHPVGDGASFRVDRTSKMSRREAQTPAASVPATPAARSQAATPARSEHGSEALRAVPSVPPSRVPSSRGASRGLYGGGGGGGGQSVSVRGGTPVQTVGRMAAEEVLKPYSLVKKGAYEEGAKLKPASNWTFLASYRP